MFKKLFSKFKKREKAVHVPAPPTHYAVPVEKRTRVSLNLRGPARLPGESYTDYRIRRRIERLMVDNYLKGERK